MRAIAKSALAFILCFAVIMTAFLFPSRDFAVGVYGYIYCAAVCLAVSVYVYITSIRREKSDDELKRAMKKSRKKKSKLKILTSQKMKREALS